MFWQMWMYVCPSMISAWKDKHVCLIFDLVVPREYKDGAVGKLRTRISSEMRRRDPDCRCAITVENSYRSEEGVK